MKSSATQSNGYLQALEKKERKRRRTKLFLLGAVGIVAAGSAILVPKMLNQQMGASAEQSPKFRSFYATELTDDKVRAFFTGGNNHMVIRYPGEDRRDTVVSYNEYASLISRSTDWQFNVVSNSDLFSDEEGDDATISAVDDALQVALGNDGESMPAANEEDNSDQISNDFGFRVRGDRSIGKTLNIQVLNFRSDIKYEMDFGDGTRQDIERTARISYDKPGVYVITLRASGDGVPRRIYATYPITIEDPNAIQLEEPLVASNERGEISSLEDNAPVLNEVSSLSSTAISANKPSIPETSLAERPTTNRTASPASTAGNNNTSPATGADNSQPFFAASKMPEFPGGNRGLSRYIQRNLRYPRVASSNQKSGKVTVRFIVDENGKAKNPHVVKGLGNPYDAEVVRMIEAMPTWAAGEQNGKKVPVYKSLRISFDLDNG